MAFDYSKLRGRIVEKYGTLDSFAKAVGMSAHSLSNKMNNRKYWKQTEIAKALKLLSIPEAKMNDYFFAEKIQNFEQERNTKQ
jgi:cob(I)alamin adenosyltransferase